MFCWRTYTAAASHAIATSPSSPPPSPPSPAITPRHALLPSPSRHYHAPRQRYAAPARHATTPRRHTATPPPPQRASRRKSSDNDTGDVQPRSASTRGRWPLLRRKFSTRRLKEILPVVTRVAWRRALRSAVRRCAALPRARLPLCALLLARHTLSPGVAHKYSAHEDAGHAAAYAPARMMFVPAPPPRRHVFNHRQRRRHASQSLRHVRCLPLSAPVCHAIAR